MWHSYFLIWLGVRIVIVFMRPVITVFKIAGWINLSNFTLNNYLFFYFAFSHKSSIILKWMVSFVCGLFFSHHSRRKFSVLPTLLLTLIRKLRGTIVNMILPPRVSFYCREFYFTAASFILLPRVLYYCREFCFTAASFVLPPRLWFSPPRVLFYRREIYFSAASFIFTVNLGAVK